MLIVRSLPLFARLVCVAAIATGTPLACASEEPARKAAPPRRPPPPPSPISNSPFPTADAEPETITALVRSLAAAQAADGILCVGRSSIRSQRRVDDRLALADRLAPWAAAVAQTLETALERHPELGTLMSALEAALSEAGAPHDRPTEALLWSMTEAAIALACEERAVARVFLPLMLAQWGTSSEALYATLFERLGPYVWRWTKPYEDFWLAQRSLTDALKEDLKGYMQAIAEGTSSTEHVTQPRQGGPVRLRAAGGGLACSAASTVTRDDALSGFGTGNGLVDRGEMLRLRVDCQNTSGERWMSESLVLEAVPPCMYHLGQPDLTLAELAPGQSLPITLGPFLVTDRCGAQETLAYRIISTHQPERRIEVQFEVRTVDPVVSVELLDRDAAGSSREGAGAVLAQGDWAELILGVRAQADLPTTSTAIRAFGEAAQSVLDTEVQLPLAFVSHRGATLRAQDDVDLRVLTWSAPRLGDVPPATSAHRGTTWLEVELGLRTPRRIVLDSAHHVHVSQNFQEWKRSNADLELARYLDVLRSLEDAADAMASKLLDARLVAKVISPSYEDARAAVTLLVEGDMLRGADLGRALDFLDELRWADPAHSVSLDKARQLFVWSALSGSLGKEEVARAIRRRGVFGLPPERAIAELKDVMLESRIAWELARHDIEATESLIAQTREVVRKEQAARARRLKVDASAALQAARRGRAALQAAIDADPWQLPRSGQLYTYRRYVPLSVATTSGDPQ